MTARLLTIEEVKDSDAMAHQILGFWNLEQSQRFNQIQKWDEIRQYLFASDTDHTTGTSTPWKNRTTRPKLTWIADKMLTAYAKKLIPNDDFFRWKSSPENKNKEKANVIQPWMKHKIRHPAVNFAGVIKECLADWLQTGNAFGGVEYIERYQYSFSKKNADGEPEKKLVFKGARPYRINPINGNMDSSASSWEESPFIHRKIMRKEDFFSYVSDHPNEFDTEQIERLKLAKNSLVAESVEEYLNEKNRNIDGVSVYESWKTGKITLLEYFGPTYDPDKDEYISNRHVLVAEGMFTIKNERNPSYLGNKSVVFAPFRKRPDNLWGMGPFENLVGMQYRIDHVENAKADALDACVYPIVKVKGDATDEHYDIKPGSHWYVPVQGDVELVYPDPRTFMHDSQVSMYEQEMEEFAGMPRETAGFRTPGEKTGFEVQQLLASAGEFPDEKLAEFENQFLEPILNLMLELNIRNLSQSDLDSLSEEDKKEMGQIELDDLRVDGRIYPVGIKHSKERAEKIGKIQALTEVGANIAPEHFRKFSALKTLEVEMSLEEDGIVEFGGGIKEMMALEKMKQEMQNQEERNNPNANTSSFGGGNPE